MLTIRGDHRQANGMPADALADLLSLRCARRHGSGQAARHAVVNSKGSATPHSGAKPSQLPEDSSTKRPVALSQLKSCL